MVAECVGPPDTRIATVVFATTAPEGSVTCPRKVPVAAGGAEDCAEAVATSPPSAATIRIAIIKFVRINTNLFNTQPFSFQADRME